MKFLDLIWGCSGQNKVIYFWKTWGVVSSTE